MFNRLHLIRSCLCCFLYINLFPNNLSAIATISSSIILEILPACFSCDNDFNLSHNSLGSDGKIIVEVPEAMIAGDLSNFISVRSLVFLLPGPLISRCISLAKSCKSLWSDKLAASTLNFLFVIFFKKPPFNSNWLFVPRKVDKLIYKVTGIVLCISKPLTLFEQEFFTNLNWLAFSGLAF